MIKQDEWMTPGFIYGIRVLLAAKPYKDIFSKASEELQELSVKLIQFNNKPESIDFDDIAEEIADVEQHLFLLKHMIEVTYNMRLKKIGKFLESDDFKNHEKHYLNGTYVK